MSIAEKLTTIAENEQKVFKAPIDYTISLCDDYINYGAPQKINTSEKYTALNNKIDELNTMSYEVGFSDGELKGSSEGYEAGKSEEWNKFWDAYQLGGNRKNYVHAFSYTGWNESNLKPKYVVQPTNAGNMFYQLGYIEGSYTVDLRPIKDKLDFSQATNMNYTFQTSKITHIGVVDVRNCGSNLNNTFGNMYYLKEIEKIIVCETNTFPSTFAQCWANKITFEGVVASDLNLAQVRCDKANFKNIIGVLSGAHSGKTLTLHKGAVTTAFGSTDSDEWKNLIATKSNWHITLL